MYNATHVEGVLPSGAVDLHDGEEDHGRGEESGRQSRGDTHLILSRLALHLLSSFDD